MHFIELLSYGFVLRAILAAALLGVACGVLSFFVVQRSLAFMGHGVAHSLVAGVGIAVLFDWPVFWPVLITAILVSTAVGWITERKQVSEDSAIGITLSAALAFGIVLVSLKKGYVADLETYLFGSLLAVLPQDLVMLGVLTLLISVTAIWKWKLLLMFAFDSEGTAISGYPVRVIRYGLLSLLAIMIAVAMKIVGILLVGAFLVIPAAAAGFWSARAGRVVWLSVLFALISAIGGMLLSISLDTPAGAAIVLMLVTFFGLSRIFGRLN
jgi:zinc transport system permease protein